MEGKDENHLDCTLSDTDIFTPSFTQKDIQHGQFEEVFPISKLNDNGPIEFSIENVTEKLIDIANSYVKLKIQIVKSDGTALADDNTVAPINYIFGSMFNQVDLSLGGTMVSSSNNLYPHRAYLETLLNYGMDAKKSQLQMGFYIKDEAGSLDQVDVQQNPTFNKKKSIASKRVKLLKFQGEYTVICSIKGDFY